MKAVRTRAACTLLLIFAAATWAQEPPSDEAAVRDVWKRFVDARNGRDAKPMESIFDAHYKETPALKTFLTCVTLKKNGQWWIAAIGQSRIDEETRPQ